MSTENPLNSKMHKHRICYSASWDDDIMRRIFLESPTVPETVSESVYIFLIFNCENQTVMQNLIP